MATNRPWPQHPQPGDSGYFEWMADAADTGKAALDHIADPTLHQPFSGGPVTSDVVHATGTGDVYTDIVDGKRYRLTIASGQLKLTTVSLGAGGGATAGIVPLVAVDSADVGSGNTYPVYTGTWAVATNTGDRAGTDRYIDAAGNVAISWSGGVDVNGTGSQVTIYATRGPQYGIAAVAVDSGPETFVDCYADTRADGVALWASPRLAVGAHTVRWRWTGTKNAASAGTTVNFDAADLANAFPRASAATAPAAPSGVTATPGNASATVTWTAAASNGSAINAYVVTSSPGGFTATTSGSTSATVNGLTNGTAYTFTVTATNSIGTGPTSAASSSVTPTSTPAVTLVPVVVIDDQDTGTGDTYPAYTGSWSTGTNAGSRGGSDTYINAAGKVVLTWTGGNTSTSTTTQVKLYGSTASHHGIGMVKVDGGTEVAVDQYSASRADNVLLWTSAALGQGQHTIEYRWSGTKNASSTGTTINVDGFDVTNAVARVSSTGTGGGGTGGTSTSGQPPITRIGTKLYRNGVQWKFAGLNAPAFFGCAGAGGIPTVAQIDAYFAGLNPHSVTRIWPYGGINDSFTVTMMDKLVASAEAHGQYLAPAFFDSNPDQCGTQALNYSSPTANVNWAKSLVARYAKNANPATAKPTNCIAFWECANEVSGSNTVSWYQAMATGIKSVDPNTLVGSGSMPQYGFDNNQSTYEAAHAGAIDLICIHEYDAQTGMSDWSGPAITAANSLNKPWYCGEDGFCCGGGDTGSKSGNAAKLGAEWDAYIGNSTCAGMLYWSVAFNLGSAAETTDVSFVSGDAMWEKAKSYRHAYHGADSAPAARYLGGNRDYNNATAYPTSIPLPGPTTIPSGVAVAAGASLQAAVNANPAGTTFILGAGTFTGSSTVVTPKAGDRFFGQGAGVTILNGIAIRAAAGINNVTVANLTIHGVTWDTFGAIDSDLSSDRAQFWQVLNCEAYGNYEGIIVGSGSTVTNNYMHDNTHAGFGGGANGSLFKYNASIHNNSSSGADGGNKSGMVGNSPIGSPAPYSSGGASTVFANNYLADNGLAGYWSDVSGTGVQYVSNISVRNTMVGLMTEIDGGSNYFSGNLVAGNGFRNVDWQDDGILLSSSGHDTVTGNWVWSNRNADIQLFNQGRQSNEGANTITNNVTSTAIATFGSTPAGANTISGNTVVAAGSINPPSVICGPQV